MMKTLGMTIAVGFLVACSLSSGEPAVAMSAQQPCISERAAAGTRVLVFSRTAAFRHQSIPSGIAAVRVLGERHGFTVEATEDPAVFTDAGLAPFQAVVFMSTTGDVLDDTQQAAFERFVRGGGGYVGVHSASDTEYDWEWYGRLVGAYFQRHPPGTPEGTVRIVNANHISTRCVPTDWTRVDEWYDYRAQPAANITILANLDESTYQGGQMGASHPIAWYHAFDGGKAWYTGMGHTNATFSEPAFLDHLAGGILWAVAP
jgi:type 1 glutamine amidotransferase